MNPTALRRTCLLLCSTLPLLLVSGCIERTLLIRSDPAGAAVYVNGKFAGTTPAEVPFDTYGTFEFIASHPRHDRLRAAIRVKPPWYQYIPFDLVVEHVLPCTIHNENPIHLELKPRGAYDEVGLEEREKEMQAEVFKP